MSNGLFQRNPSFFKVPEGVQHFPGGGGGGVQLFPGGGGGGVYLLIPIETHITCDFPGGVRTPVPPSGSALALHNAIYQKCFCGCCNIDSRYSQFFV